MFPTRYQGDSNTPFPVLQEWVNASPLKFREFIPVGMRVKITDEVISKAYGYPSTSRGSLKRAFQNATEHLDIPDPFEDFAMGLCFAFVNQSTRVNAERDAEIAEKLAKLKSEREAEDALREQEAEREAEKIAETRRQLGLDE